MNANALPDSWLLARSWLPQSHRADVMAHAWMWQAREIVLYGRRLMQPRLVDFYGPAYRYSGQTLPARPLPDCLTQLAEDLLPVGAARPNACLLNRYRDGADSIAWHADDEPSIDQTAAIWSVSIGASRMFKVRRRATGETWSTELCDGDLVVMPPGAQREFQHSIPKTRRAGERWNLTFRTMRGLA